MFLVRADTLRGEVGGGGGLALEIEFFGPLWNRAWEIEFFGLQMALSYRLDAISQSPKNSRIPEPNPLPLPLVMDMHASKTLCTGPNKS